MSNAYIEALQVASAELKKLAAQRASLDRRMLRVKQTIATLMRLTAGDEPSHVSNKGITDAIRDALKFGLTRATPHATPRVLKEFLETIGYDFSDYKNPLASINGTLQKMVERGEVKRVRVSKTGEKGEKVYAYMWNESKEQEEAKK